MVSLTERHCVLGVQNTQQFQCRKTLSQDTNLFSLPQSISCPLLTLALELYVATPIVGDLLCDPFLCCGHTPPTATLGLVLYWKCQLE